MCDFIINLCEIIKKQHALINIIHIFVALNVLYAHRYLRDISLYSTMRAPN